MLAGHAVIGEDHAIAAPDPDTELRQAAIAAARELAIAYGDLIPVSVLRAGFEFQGGRVTFGSFMKGIHRASAQTGPAALSVMTAAPRLGKPAPYEDMIDRSAGAFLYHYRAGSPDQPDNRSLRAAFELQAPLIYFVGYAPGQYQAIAPVFITDDDPSAGMVVLETGLPYQDTQGDGIVSSVAARAEQFTMVVRRLDQFRFRRDVLYAYRARCAVCSLKEIQLIEAAHIIRHSEPDGIAAVVNGIALCAIHHLAYDRNLLGIDPNGVVHIGERLLREVDGPMLKTGLQGFHGAAILRPNLATDHPDPDRLGIRFHEFEAAA